jgi:chemotaxis protein CheC
VPDVSVVRLEDVGTVLGDPGMVVSAVILRVEGEIEGRALQIFPETTAVAIASALTRVDAGPLMGFGAMQRSTMMEVGNTLTGAYLSALSMFIGKTTTTSVPALAIDMAAAVMTTGYLNFGEQEDYVFCMSTRLGFAERPDLPAHFLLLPDGASLQVILRALHLDR